MQWTRLPRSTGTCWPARGAAVAARTRSSGVCWTSLGSRAAPPAGPASRQRREQHQQLGGGELSRLSTSKAIGAVAVEVHTEEELAVQAACGWEIEK